MQVNEAPTHTHTEKLPFTELVPGAEKVGRGTEFDHGHYKQVAIVENGG